MERYLLPLLKLFAFYCAAIFLGIATAFAQSQETFSSTIDNDVDAQVREGLLWGSQEKADGAAARKQALENLLSKLNQNSPLFGKLQQMLVLEYGVPYTPFFTFTKTVGENWYIFGLTADAGYQAIARADALKADLQANASVSAGVNVVLFGNTFPVLDGMCGAGLGLNITRGSGLSLKSTSQTTNKDKWLPKIHADVKLFGIVIWEKNLPANPDTAKADANQSLFDNMQSAATERADQVKDQFNQYAQAVQTNIGQGTNSGATVTDLSGKPKSAADLKKDLLDFKRGVKEILGYAIVIPVVPPLNIEIDFGVFFSHSLVFELGIEGMGFKIGASTDLSKSPAPGQSIVGQLKDDLKSNQLVNGFSSIVSGDLSGSVLGLLKGAKGQIGTIEEIFSPGLADLALIADKGSQLASLVSGGLGRMPSTEVKAFVRVLPAASAGAWVKAAAVLDIVVANAAAGVKGTLNLIQAKAGGSLEFSSAADYADLVALGSLNAFSGKLELFAEVSFIANIVEPLQWSEEVFTFPGKTWDFKFPIARLAYRDQGSPRVFLCIDSDFKRATHPIGPESTDECDLSTRLVPSQMANDLTSDINALVTAHGIEPPEVRICTIVLNSNTIVASPKEATDQAKCENYVTDPGKFAKIIEQARTQYPEKFVSNLFDDQGKPAVLLEAYYGNTLACPSGCAQYVNEGVSAYSLQKWGSDTEPGTIVYNARHNFPTTGNLNDPANPNNPDNLNSYIPPQEPTLTLNGMEWPVREIGWNSNEELFDYAKMFLAGFCRIEGPADLPSGCAYNVRALGVKYPDGQSCVPSDWNKLQRFAAQYDCAPKDNNADAPKKAAACLVRKAFSQELCFPPSKAGYIVHTVYVLKTTSDGALYAKLKAGHLNSSALTKKCTLQSARIDPSVECGRVLAPNQSCSTITQIKQTDFNATRWLQNMKESFSFSDSCYPYCDSLKRSINQGLYDNNKIFCKATNPGASASSSNSSCGFRLHKGESGSSYYYLRETPGECDVWIQSSGAGSLFIKKVADWDKTSGSCGALLPRPAIYKAVPFTGCRLDYEEDWYRQTPAGPPLKDVIGFNVRDAIKNFQCEYPLALEESAAVTADDPLALKPQTCELVTFFGAVMDTYSGGTVSTAGECKDAFATNIDLLCRSYATKILAALSDAGITGLSAIPLASRFAGDQIEDIGGCFIDSNGGITAMESGPTVSTKTSTVASAAKGCQLIVGSDTANKFAVAKVFQGINEEGATSTTCANMITNNGKVSACSQISTTAARALRASGMNNLAMMNVYARLTGYQKDASGNLIKDAQGNPIPITIGSPVSLGSCDLNAPPPPQAVCKVSADYKSSVCQGACELLAQSPAKGTKPAYKVLIGKTSQAAQTACLESFKPYSVLCEKLPTLPEIKRENAATSGAAFAAGDSVPLSVRFSAWDPASKTLSAPVETSIGSCPYGATQNVGSLCELLVAVPSNPTFTANMNGTNQNQIFPTRSSTGLITFTTVPWKTVDMSSKASSTLQACKDRFLTGSLVPSGAPAGTAAQQKLDPTCWGLSRQLVKASNTTKIPDLKNVTVGVSVRFKASATATPVTASLGSCSYNANGNSTLLPDPGKLTGPNLIAAAEIGTVSNLAGPVGVEITELNLEPPFADQFTLKVRYAGPLPPAAPYTKFVLQFPGQWALPGAVSAASTLGKTAATATTTTTAPAPASVTLGGKTTTATATATTIGPAPASATPGGKTSATALTTTTTTTAPPSIPTRGPYNLPQPGQILSLGPFPISLMGGAVCMKDFRAQVITKMIPPVPQATVTATSVSIDGTRTGTVTPTTTSQVKWPAVEKTFRKVMNVPCVPRIEIAKATVTAPEDGYPANLVLEYTNSGGTPATTLPLTSKQFVIKVKNTTASAANSNILFTNPTLSTVTLPIPAAKTTAATAAFLLSDLLGVSGKTYCGSKILDLSLEAAPEAIGATPPVNVPGYKFTTPVRILCGVDLEITGANYKSGTTNVIQVNYKNNGAAPANTAALTNKFKLTATPPISFAAPALKTANVIPNSGLAGAPIEITLTGQTCGAPVAIGFSAIRESTGLSIGQKTITLTPPCPPAPKIEIQDLIVTAPEAGAPASYQLTFKNAGAAVTASTPGAWKNFNIQVTNVTSGKVANLSALTTPVAAGAVGSSNSTPFDGIARAGYCSGGAKAYNATFFVTTSVSSPNYKFTKNVTVFCGVNLEITGIAYKPGSMDTVVVDFKNSGSTAAPTYTGGAITNKAGYDKFKIKLTPPTTFLAAPVEKTALSIPQSGLASKAEITLTGQLSCGTPMMVSLDAIRDVTSAYLIQKKIVLLTQPCPQPKITVYNFKSAGTASSFYVAYKNIGDAVASYQPQAFSLTVKNLAANKTKVLTGLAIPSPTASALSFSQPIPLSDLGMSCGAPASLEVTTSLSASGYVFTGPWTEACPKHDLVTGSVYMDSNFSNIRVGWGKSANPSGTDTCAGKTFKIKVRNAAYPTTTKICIASVACGGSNGTFTPMSSCATGSVTSVNPLGVAKGASLAISIDEDKTINEFNEGNNICTAPVGDATNSLSGYGLSFSNSRTGACTVPAP